jgi:hypothetical protein
LSVQVEFSDDHLLVTALMIILVANTRYEMRKFLTLKHWQLFILLIGGPIIIEFIVIGIVIANRSPQLFAYYIPVMLIWLVGLFFAWFYSLGTNLSRKVPPTAGMSIRKFKLFLFIPLVYMVSITLFVLLIFSHYFGRGYHDPGIFLFILPLHLFSMFCMFYCSYFIAKALKAVELQRPVTFSDYAGDFVLLWIYPIGIWVLQPRINRLFDQDSTDV